jgi:sugar lactone lactonase YvrE
MLGEAPRWHDGRLYVSDMNAEEVIAIDFDGNRETVVAVPGRPSGLGWLPNGDMLVASMRDAALMRFNGTSLELVSSVAPTSPLVNDMVVSADGRAYVGGMPDLYALVGDGADGSAMDVTIPRERLYLVDAAAESCRIVAEDLDFPNGVAITPDGRLLIVAETMATRLLAFDIDADGSLANQRVWAQLGSMLPDGLCLDAEGCAWVAVPEPSEARGFWRVTEGGEIKDQRRTERCAVAVMLGGPEGTDLFMLEATSIAVEDMAQTYTRGNSRLLADKVDVPGAALP